MSYKSKVRNIGIIIAIIIGILVIFTYINLGNGKKKQMDMVAQENAMKNIDIFVTMSFDKNGNPTYGSTIYKTKNNEEISGKNTRVMKITYLKNIGLDIHKCTLAATGWSKEEIATFNAIKNGNE